MTESGAARPGDSQGRNLLHETLGEILASPTLHPSIEKTMLDGQAEPQPDRNPSCVAAEKSGRRLAWAGLESVDAIKTGCRGLSVVEQPASLALPSIRRTTSRPTSDKGLKRSLSRAEPKVRIQLPPAASQVRTCLSREFAFLRREVAIFRRCAGRGKRRGRQRRAGRGNIGLAGGNISVRPYSSTAPPVIWAA